MTADRTTFSGNTAAGGRGGTGAQGNPVSNMVGWQGGFGGLAYGGAIYGGGLVSRSTFAANGATGGAGGTGGGGWRPGEGGIGGFGAGGAVSGASSLINCTIAFNHGNGGAGGAGGNETEEMPNDWPGGTGGDGGSGVGGLDGTWGLINCTVASNSGYGGSGGPGGASGIGNPAPSGSSGTASAGTGAGGSANTLIAYNTPAGGDTFPNPALGPLADNGGPTLTMALLPGSPAIDAGNTSLAPADDQRGFPRPAGLAADIGAFEYGSVMPTIAVSRSGPAGLNIVGTGNTGQSCRLLSSPDLLNWVPIATNQIGNNGTILFNDTCAPGGACRFYRLVMP